MIVYDFDINELTFVEGKSDSPTTGLVNRDTPLPFSIS